MSGSIPSVTQVPTAADSPISRGGDLPRLLGQYALLHVIGAGGMGTVYKARHLNLKTYVALKLLPAGRVGDAEALSRFYSEMQAIGQLRHPNVVGATDAGEVHGEHFLVMEYVDGPNLGQLVKFHKSLEAPLGCQLILQAAQGLQAIHESHLIHRDIKPSNIALSKKGLVKILDLGLAKLNTGSGTTLTGQVMGTIDYMSPEQADNSKSVDIRTDIYSLGCTLYKLLTGEAPFAKYSSAPQKLQAIWSEDFPPLPDRNDIRPELRNLLKKMTAKRADDRFSTPQDLIHALSPLAGGDLAPLASQWEDSDSSHETAFSSSRSLLSSNVETDDIAVRECPRIEATPRKRWRRALTWLAGGVGLAVLIAWVATSGSESSQKSVIDPPIEDRVVATSTISVHQIQFQKEDPATWEIIRSGTAIRMAAEDTSLLSLGKAESPADLKLATDILQPGGTGRIGFFFNFSPSNAPGMNWQYEMLEIQRLQDGRHKLAHGFCLMTRSHKLRYYHLGSVPLTDLQNVSKELAIELRQGKLDRVVFGGKDYQALIDSPYPLLSNEAEQALTQSISGQYGIISKSGAAKLSNFRIDNEHVLLTPDSDLPSLQSGER